MFGMKSSAILVFLLFLVGEATPQEVGSQPKCGQRVYEQVADVDLSYGKDADPGQWPWYGSVYHYRTDRSIVYACGGTLISGDHVLTVAVCVLDGVGSLLSSGDIMVRLGTHHQNLLNFGNARYRRVKFVHLPNDEVEDAHGGGREIAILELTEHVNFNDYVLPICMMVHHLDDGHGELMVGWGVNEDVKQLGVYFGNDTCYFSNDRASIGMVFLIEDWFLQYFTHCSEEKDFDSQGRESNMITLKRYESWITKITKLNYLQKLRSGQEFNSSQEYPQLLPQRHCGRGLIDGERSSQDATLYEFPWIAKLYNLAQGYNCLGTLISHRYVLTSENCINFYYIPDFIVLGEYDYLYDPDCKLEDSSDCAPKVRYYEVDYIVRSDNDYPDRIDLIRTTENVAFEDHIQPICLPLTSELKRLQPSEYTVAGWNENSNSNSTDAGTIQKESIYAASSAACQIDLPNNGLLYRTGQRDIANITLLGGPVGAIVSSFRMRFVQYAIIVSPVERCVVALDIIPFIDWIRANMHE